MWALVSYDQVAQIELPSWSKGRVVLVGDACYAVSLIAGQGASLGVAGAYLLADRLARAKSVSEALVEYERLWRPVAASQGAWLLLANQARLARWEAGLLLVGYAASLPLIVLQ